MWKRTIVMAIGLLGIMLVAGVCSPGGDEPGRVTLPVVSDGGGIEICENGEGWTVELTALRIAIRNLEFTIEGEIHAALLLSFSEFFVPSAFAHPGHASGGDVTGELTGDFIVDLFALKDQYMGEGDLLTGNYHGMNLYFRKASEADGLDAGDPLLGHTVYMAGRATKGTQDIEFTAVLDELEENTQMVGGPFELDVFEDTSATLVLRVYTRDPVENDTVFEGLDFGKLDDDDDGVVTISPGDEAHNVLIKTLERHDHWGVTVL
jgi:hypothetical protein